MKLKRLLMIGLSISALAGVAVFTLPELAAAAPGDQLTLTAIGEFLFPADERVTSAAGARRVDLRAIVSSSRVGVDVTRITPDTDFFVDAAFFCTGGREAFVTYGGDFPLSDLDDRFLRCGIGRRGASIFGAIGLFEPPGPR